MLFLQGGGGTPHSGQKGCLFKACSILKGRENRHFSKIRCKVKEMAAKAKCIQGCQFWQKQQRKTHSREPLSNWARRTESLEKCCDHRKFYCFCMVRTNLRTNFKTYQSVRIQVRAVEDYNLKSQWLGLRPTDGWNYRTSECFLLLLYFPVQLRDGPLLI